MKKTNLKTGLYEVFGNTVKYQQGKATGKDLDSLERIPVDIIITMGIYLGKVEE